MNLRSLSISMMTGVVALLCGGCDGVSGRPEAVVRRPDQVLNFAALYKQNCAACHGEDGKEGAAISLANPVYLAVAGTSVMEKVTADGVPGSLMPAFAKSQGGTLTDQQIAALVQGLESSWGKSGTKDMQPPPYASSLVGNPASGLTVYMTFCASCHGADGTGVVHGKIRTGSLVDPAYLALISDQGLRSLIIAGQPGEGMPDWRSDITGTGSRAMTDQEITDVVAWLASHRVASPGQPYVHP